MMGRPGKRRIILVVVSVLAAIVFAFMGFVWWNFGAQRAAELVPAVTTVAENLEIPWALAFLPDGSIMVTERPGRIRIIDPRDGLLLDPLLTIAEVAHRGEGGLLGLALYPEFSSNGLVYVYYTYDDGGRLGNKVVRYRKSGKELLDPEVVLDGIPGANIHNGGRIKFGPDGLLYITTGDASISTLAQDINSLAGKILRINPDGTIPLDNPFPDSPVYSYGHRNPQGLAWDGQGRLWATEHGSSATDELNLIEPGKNYGWPAIRGDETAPQMQSPVIQSGSETWAPSGLAFRDGALFFAGLRSQSLFEVSVADVLSSLERHLDRKYGRLREVVVGPDSYLYVTTNNRDGRGVPLAGDDRILQINPSALTFGPDGITGHPDHIAIGDAASSAFYKLNGKGGWPRKFYYVTIPDSAITREAELCVATRPDHEVTAVDISDST